MVLGLCRLLLRDPVEAEDAAQQVYVSAQRALAAGAVPREPARWLAAIARNECRARVRARMREPLALPELPADIPDPLAAAIHTADLDALWSALSALPRRQRKAFLLRELGGLSYEELGVALGVTRPAVESLLFRARQRLRITLMTVNTAAVPVALRDQLARFLPLGSPTGGAPFAAKVVAVTVGVGLGAAGVVELPKHHAPHQATRPPGTAPVAVQSVSRDAARPTLAVAETSHLTRSDRRGRSGHDRGRNEAEHEAEHRGRDAHEPTEHEAEPEAEPPEPEAAEPEQEFAAPEATTDGGSNRGGDGGGSDGTSGESGDSGSHDGGTSGHG
jgi:RNA polymerase sigma factor (sigma-70 family)